MADNDILNQANPDKIVDDTQKQAELASKIFGQAAKDAEEMIMAMDKLGSQTDQNTLKTTALAIALGKSNLEFQKLAGIDTKNLTTFTDQFKTMFDIMGKSTAGDVLTSTAGKIGEALLKIGKPAGEVRAAINAIANGVDGAKDTFIKYAQNALNLADNNLLLSNTLLQTAASAGSLGAAMASPKAGTIGMSEGLTNVNEVLNRQIEVMTQAAQATNVPNNTMAQYLITLSKVPGAMEAIAKGTDESGNSFNLLTDATDLAVGSGRSFDDVSKNMLTAAKEFGLAGEEGLKYTAQISQAAKETGTDIGDMDTAFTKATGGIKDYVRSTESAAKMTEGIRNSISGYVQSLESIHIPAKNALDIATKMTDSMHNLNEAQLAFVSMRTGGPGGMMGAAQLEQMLQKGDYSGMAKKLQQTIESMTGKIVTTEEATKSQSAANRREYQRKLLMQGGPLGLNLGMEESANFLDASAKGRANLGTRAGGKSAEEVLRSFTKTGDIKQGQMTTPVGQMNVAAEKVMLNTGGNLLQMIQVAGTRTTGGGELIGGETPAEAKMREALNAVHASTKSGKTDSTELLNSLRAIKDLPSSVISAMGTFQSSKQTNADLSNLEKAVQGALPKQINTTNAASQMKPNTAGALLSAPVNLAASAKKAVSLQMPNVGEKTTGGAATLRPPTVQKVSLEPGAVLMLQHPDGKQVKAIVGQSAQAKSTGQGPTN